MQKPRFPHLPFPPAQREQGDAIMASPAGLAWVVGSAHSRVRLAPSAAYAPSTLLQSAIPQRP